MSNLTERRDTWTAREAVRQFFHHKNGERNENAFAAHKREGRVLALAEAIRDHGNPSAADLQPAPEPGEIWEAEDLAAAG